MLQVASGLSRCCICFTTHVASICFKCFMCFRHMLHSSVSCCKCFMFQRYVQRVIGAWLKMATGTYPTGSGHPHPHPHPPSCTRRVTRNRTRVGKCAHTRIRTGKFYPTGNPHPTTYPRITYKYQTFTCKNKSFQASNKIQTNIHIMTSLQYIY
jgi:hypothetical protein